MSRLIAFIVTAFVIVGVVFCSWIAMHPRPLEKIFASQIDFGSRIIYESDNGGKTWRNTNKGVYQFWRCSFDYVDRPTWRPSNGITDKVISIKTLPATLGFLLFDIPILSPIVNISTAYYQQGGQFMAGFCTQDYPEGNIYVHVERYIGLKKYSGMLIGYDHFKEDDYTDLWQSWTLRPIEGEPFIGDAALEASVMFRFLVNLVSPFPFLLHLFLMAQVWQNAYPIGQQRQAYRAAGVITLLTMAVFGLSAIRLFLSYQPNSWVALLSIVGCTSLMSAVVGYRIAKQREFSILFRRQLGIASALAAWVVPVCWFAGWWSWVFAIIPLYSYLYYQRGLHQYSERNGYNAPEWAINANLAKLLCPVPIGFSVLTLVLNQGNALSKELYFIDVAIFIVIMAFALKRLDIASLFFGGGKKKQAHDAETFSKWAQWHGDQCLWWLFGLIPVLGGLWVVQYGVYLLNDIILKAITPH